MEEQDNNQTSDIKNKFKSIRQWMGAEIILMIGPLIWLVIDVYDLWKKLTQWKPPLRTLPQKWNQHKSQLAYNLEAELYQLFTLECLLIFIFIVRLHFMVKAYFALSDD